MYSTQNEGKSVLAGRFIIALKNEICKYITSISKDVYIDKLDDIMTYIVFGKAINDKDPKFKVGDNVTISKYKNIFTKGYVPN